MWPTNLDANERAAYVRAQSMDSTSIGIEADLLNLDHKHVTSLAASFVDGQVDFNRGTDVERSLQIGFRDPDDDLLDLDLRYLIQVKNRLYVPELDKWAVTPMFTGQIVVPSTDGETTVIEAHGKEAFGLQVGAPRQTWKAGRRIAVCIREMFEELGETKFRISSGLEAELKSDMTSGGRDANKAPTRVARKMASGPGYQVFYDELGFLVVRRRPKQPLITWSEGDGSLLSPVRFTRDLREIKNVVKASGKKQLTYTAWAHPKHTFSPHNLQRGGVAGRRVDYWDQESISKRAELRKSAEDRLDKLLTDVTNAELDCLPAYHVGPQDRVKAVKRNGRFGEFYPNEASVPLGAGVMTVGYQERVRKQAAGRIRLG